MQQTGWDPSPRSEQVAYERERENEVKGIGNRIRAKFTVQPPVS